MGHVVLLGDSIFDNRVYVEPQPAVIDQLAKALPAGWRATLLAVDGAVTKDVATQLIELPSDTTHLVISVGGNDALGNSPLIAAPCRTVDEGLRLLGKEVDSFSNDYRRMLIEVRKTRLPTVVCTVYDAVPGLGVAEKLGLTLFNDRILRWAAAARCPILDLRMICTEASDYAAVSPIEPSHLGGAKIAAAIARSITSITTDSPPLILS